MVYVRLATGPVVEAEYINRVSGVDVIAYVFDDCASSIVWDVTENNCITVYDFADACEMFDVLDAWEAIEKDSAEARGEKYVKSGELKVRQVSAEFRANYPAL